MSKGPIVIVGAGPTGLLLAGELARRGREVRIIERAPAAPRESRAGGVHSRTLELLRRLGIAEELMGIGNPLTAMAYAAGGREVFRVDFSGLDSPYPCMLHVPQYETQGVLERHLERLGVAVERGIELVGLEQDAAGVAVTTQQAGVTATFEACYVVGCDGAHSTVRHQLGMPFEGKGYGQDWIGADVDVDWANPESEGRIFVEPAGVLACFPFGRGRWRIIAPQVADRPEERASPDLEEVRRLVAERGPAGMHIANPTWLGAFRASRRSAPHYRQGRVLLAGDAVHIHSPAAGQGMNTGLGDAANLGWKLALVDEGRAPEGLLDSYGAERTPVARQVIAFTHALVRAFGTEPGLSPMQRRARDWLLPKVTAQRQVQRAIARRMGQHVVNYRGGPLTIGRGRGSLRAGDRAPEVTGVTVGGEASTAFGLMAHPGHTVFVVDEPNRLAGLYQRAGAFGSELRLAPVDGADPLARRYGLGAGWACVVRPDGYIGYLGSSAGIDAYLASWFNPLRSADPQSSSATAASAAR